MPCEQRITVGTRHRVAPLPPLALRRHDLRPDPFPHPSVFPEPPPVHSARAADWRAARRAAAGRADSRAASSPSTMPQPKQRLVAVHQATRSTRPVSTSRHRPAPNIWPVRNAPRESCRAGCGRRRTPCGGLEAIVANAAKARAGPRRNSGAAQRPPAAPVSTSPPSAESRVRSPGTAASTSRTAAAGPWRNRPRPRTVCASAGSPSRPGAAQFLIIGLDRFRQAGMGDEADVGLVDAHAEGDRRGHHHFFGRDGSAPGPAPATSGARPA